MKIDKADAIIALEGTQEGVTLTCELRRTAAYPTEQHYLVRFAGEEGPPMTVTSTAAAGPPDCTSTS